MLVSFMVKNLTPHQVVVILDDYTVTFEPSGIVARVSQTLSRTGTAAGGIPVFSRYFGDVIGLPEREAGVLLIVSALVKSALPDRKDLLSPAELIRDGQGNVIGCNGFIS
jgi:hypothetical protein